MKHWVNQIASVVLLLSACTVNTPVVEGSNARLGEDLGAWCDSLCEAFVECQTEATPEEREGCPENCVSYFTETYVGKGEVCESAAFRVMDCMEDASCPELVDDACNIIVEEARCEESFGRVECRNEDTSVAPNGAPFQCDLGLSDCSDGQEYRLYCESGEPPDCYCSVDGSITGQFTPRVLVCPSTLEAKQICGWPISNGDGEPESPMPATCMAYSSTGSGAPDDCEIVLSGCSDGHDYGIQCENIAGAVSCRCEIDGSPVGFVGSEGAICSFADDPDGVAVRLNYACGFKLAPIDFLEE